MGHIYRAKMTVVQLNAALFYTREYAFT